MPKKLVCFIEWVLQWYFWVRITMLNIWRKECGVVKQVCSTPDYTVCIVESSTLINYDQWLPINTKVPVIGVCDRKSVPSYIACLHDKACEKKVYFILVNHAFFTLLTDEMRDALLEHEFAHIRRGDIEMHVCNTIDLSAELLADFAVAQIGKGLHLLDALTQIRNLIPNTPWRRRALRILDFRITYLRKHSIPQYEDQLLASVEIKDFLDTLDN